MPIKPALSPTMKEGKLVRWLGAPGDAVWVGDLLAQAETDKATMEIEAEEDGVLSQVLIAEGAEGIKVGALIAWIASDWPAPYAESSRRRSARRRSRLGLTVQIANGDTIVVLADKVLVTVGRQPATSGWGLENMAVNLDGQFVKVDDQCRTWMTVGSHVSELSAAFVLALEMGAVLEDPAGTIHAHSTLSEAFHEASLRGLGSALHI